MLKEKEQKTKNNHNITSADNPPPIESVKPPPEPISPVYTQLKELHLTTALVCDGKANIIIVVPASGIYDEQAVCIQRAIEEITGVLISIARDDSDASVIPIQGNLIVLGNRSTNRTIGELYNRFYTLLDLRYPGPEGYVVRTLHNPFGDGHNVIFVGGSDLTGVNNATDIFINKLQDSNAKKGLLSIDWLAEIRLGKGIAVPTDIREAEIWEASAGYGSTGYFGWNSISKHMAFYYMTGDKLHAREFLRKAFPDEQAKREIDEIDGERIEDKDDPLAGPYHYNAHLMILLWDLIEESPFFTDEERIKVTNAFARQLNHRKGESIYGRTKPPASVGTRHGQWSAISLYCLGRYFQKDYPNSIWRHCMEAAKLHFAPLHEHAWVSGENDNLFWYNTAIAPVLVYMLLTGDREQLQNGVLNTLLRGQEILISGRQPDWALNSAAISFLHQATYLTQDGRWLTYRNRTGVDLDVFRLGQSFWPEEHLQPQIPSDLLGKWSINPLPEPMWQARGSGLPFQESFQFGSFRSVPDDTGDFILIDGFNGASRNPYHTFAILELRLAGKTLLEGYWNQVLVRADGMMEPQVAMDAALKDCDVVGKTAMVVAEVPKTAYCNWRRTLIQRLGCYSLVVDDLVFQADSDNIEAQFRWQGNGIRTIDSISGTFSLKDAGLQFCEPVQTEVKSNVATMEWRGEVEQNEHRIFFSLISPTSGDEKNPTCTRLAENAAALALPESALVVAGEYSGVQGKLVVLAETHLYGRSLTRLELDDVLVTVNEPIDLDWDFASGELSFVADQEVHLCLALDLSVPITLNGQKFNSLRSEEGLVFFTIPPGRHVLEGAKPNVGQQQKIASYLATMLSAGRKIYHQNLAKFRDETPTAPALETAFTANVGGQVTALTLMPTQDETFIAVTEGETVHLLASDGKEVRKFAADGPIRVLNWWDEHQLLLVGCTDEKVIAFDRYGERKWVFTSEMDIAVYRAAKTYWFKSAPGHEGIHGLHTGVFLNGESQAFVGSACTLEILDENGQLVKRLPVFWGTGAVFAIIDGPDESLNLLVGRSITDGPQLATINNQTLDPNPRGFYTAPTDHTYIGGWANMSRWHIFYDDIDNDGEKEVVSEINGTWNRITIWNAQGRALHNAQFGPGDPIPAKNIRDLDVADLDGDGQKEILVATSSGLVVALDCRCQKVWSKRLTSPPTVMKCVRLKDNNATWVVVGCEDGTVAVLDKLGNLIRLDKVSGQPTCIEAFSTSTNGSVVLLATNQGEVKGFTMLNGMELN